ncbi:disease resistance protein TAO1 [Raphanus sativus]|uniref:ADP-ribosyl cyclase/cyclic ADP-ribose hydrolase n=1 Tax=Raphanus sativus TaxID=3726 RepID=A0A6J0KN73_RAPSA|nr:disease resistance protein TAO1 [Raphanus sativus]
MASSSSLTLLSPPFSSHHVFPSFHGADVRKSILSHIVKELKSKGIDLFIDNDIERSKLIGTALVEAIRGSRIAIVLLSQNYASSTWCLNELVEIIKCRKEFGQTVISLFYQVDPTHVKKQTGDFGKVFKKTCQGKTEEEIRRWQHALTEVAQLAGYHSTNWETEAEMIEAIATDVSNKLNLSAPSSDFDDLVGMESHMTQLEPLLQLDSSKVRKIGIWGPPGIGKTTIARYFFNRHARDFQMSVFMGNIKRKHAAMACSDDYSVKLKLQKKIMSKLTNDKDTKVQHLGVAKDRLKHKKVLVVLDDVDRSAQVEAMANETWFGPGSRILVTTEDQKVLKSSGIDHILKVNLPSYGQALQMFCMYAFDQKYPKDGFEKLAWEVMPLVGRLPLGLRVMGSYFRGMSEQEWTEALPRLRTHLDRDREIENILKFSYDALCDEDKSLFLHIACFFYDELGEIEIVKSCLASCFLDVSQGLHILAEKSLITMKNGSIHMAELLLQLGRKIVREENVSEPWKRRFLHDAEDIEEVLNDDKIGSSNVRGINLHWKDYITCTNERAFKGLSNLQFLRINGLGISPQKEDYISQRLRVLIWDRSEMTCFPSNFNPKFLVKLEMPDSKHVKFWEGIKPLNNLKWMDLSYSDRLKELPDLSTAVNLQELSLRGCESLVKLPSSIGNAINLRKLNLTECSGLVEIPSSIGNAINLRELNLKFCESLVEIPSSITTITYLKINDLNDCSSLVELPFNIETVLDPTKIDLSGCSSLVELPFSIGNAIDLQELDLSNCSSLTKLPSSMRNLHRLSELELRGCSKLEVNLANINLESIEVLDLSGCSSLKSYHESSTETGELDPWRRRISRLQRLYICRMKKLVSLPQLPDSLSYVDASNCESLERLDCSFGNPDILLNFKDCFKLNQEAKDLIIQTPTNQYAVFPAEEVPSCFTYRSSGSSVNVKLNRLPLGTSTKFKACIIFGGEGERGYRGADVCCSITSGGNPLISCYKRIKRVYLNTSDFAHLYTFEVEVKTEEVTSTDLTFEFDLSYEDWRRTFKTLEVKECGILQLPEVSLLNFTDVVGDYEPSDMELVREDDGDKRLLIF